MTVKKDHQLDCQYDKRHILLLNYLFTQGFKMSIATTHTHHAIPSRKNFNTIQPLHRYHSSKTLFLKKKH